jgi:hypothetical protein
LSGTPFRASPGLGLFILCAHAAAGAAAWISISGAAGAAIGLLAMVAGGLAAHGRALLLAPDSPSSLAFSAAGELRIVDRIGRNWVPVAHAPRYVSRWLVILPASGPAGRVRRLLVTRDMLPAEPFRRLRIWALWGAAAQPVAN